MGHVSGMGRSLGLTCLECFGLCLQFSLSYKRSSVPLTWTPNASSLTGCFRSLFLSQSCSRFCKSDTRSADSFLNKEIFVSLVLLMNDDDFFTKHYLANNIVVDDVSWENEQDNPFHSHWLHVHPLVEEFWEGWSAAQHTIVHKPINQNALACSFHLVPFIFFPFSLCHTYHTTQ